MVPMPEGPSLVLLREAAQRFSGKTVRSVAGNATIDLERMRGKRIKALRTWGKHFLIVFSGFSLRVHLLMFGSYRIDERKPATPRLRLGFAKGEISFYTCDLRYIEGDLDDSYDWRADVMSDAWSPRLASNTLKALPDALVCDVLLDQQIFSGVGNIMRNEVLFRTRVHPHSRVGALPANKKSAIIREARAYAFDFLEWKRAGVLKRNFLVHTRRVCPRCDGALRKDYPGRTRRRTFYCPECQTLFA
jgi:endonuclease-8